MHPPMFGGVRAAQSAPAAAPGGFGQGARRRSVGEGVANGVNVVATMLGLGFRLNAERVASVLSDPSGAFLVELIDSVPMLPAVLGLVGAVELVKAEIRPDGRIRYPDDVDEEDAETEPVEPSPSKEPPAEGPRPVQVVESENGKGEGGS